MDPRDSLPTAEESRAARLEASVGGVLLCRVAQHRLAFPAAHVAAVESWSSKVRFPHAGTAFQVSANKGRVLIAPSGEAVGVESIEVHAEAVSVLPPPPLLLGSLGGSLLGFVQAKQQLWPLFRVAEFSRFLSVGAEA